MQSGDADVALVSAHARSGAKILIIAHSLAARIGVLSPNAHIYGLS
jgi:hypothetical protein